MTLKENRVNEFVLRSSRKSYRSKLQWSKKEMFVHAHLLFLERWRGRDKSTHHVCLGEFWLLQLNQFVWQCHFNTGHPHFSVHNIRWPRSLSVEDTVHFSIHPVPSWQTVSDISSDLLCKQESGTRKYTLYQSLNCSIGAFTDFKNKVYEKHSILILCTNQEHTLCKSSWCATLRATF